MSFSSMEYMSTRSNASRDFPAGFVLPKRQPHFAFLSTPRPMKKKLKKLHDRTMLPGDEINQLPTKFYKKIHINHNSCSQLPSRQNNPPSATRKSMCFHPFDSNTLTRFQSRIICLEKSGWSIRRYPVRSNRQEGNAQPRARNAEGPNHGSSSWRIQSRHN